MMDWIKILSTIPKKAISVACDNYLRDQPRRRPTPGDIRQKAFGWMTANGYAKRPRLGHDTPLLPAAERCSQSAAEAIMAQVGFTPKHLDAITRRPMARTRSELVAAGDVQKVRHWSEMAGPDDPRWATLRQSRAANSTVQDAIASAKKRGF